MNIEETIKNTAPLSLSAKTVINIMYTSAFCRGTGLPLFKSNDLTPQQYNVLRILRGQKESPFGYYSGTNDRQEQQYHAPHR